MTTTPEPVALRVAQHENTLVLDLGHADGRCIVIRPGEWHLEPESPVLFRRTRLTSPIPLPTRALYTDDDVNILSFRRVLGMTTIDVGALRGDLAERILLAELDPSRRTTAAPRKRSIPSSNRSARPSSAPCSTKPPPPWPHSRP